VINCKKNKDNVIDNSNENVENNKQIKDISSSFMFPTQIDFRLNEAFNKQLAGSNDVQEILDELAAALEINQIKSPTLWVRRGVKKA
jgi:hypothetical protein